MYRKVHSNIVKLLQRENPPILLFLGLRQTGKTTLAKSVSEGKKVQMFNFDLASDKEEFLNHTRHSLAAFAERYKGYLIFIDEVQKLPESTAVIKHLYDNFNFSFILTGSSELKIRQSVSDTLAGRVKTFRIYPLSFEEIAVQKDIIQIGQKLSFDSGQKLLQNALVFGTLPQIQNIPPDEHALYLRDFIDTLLSKDVLEIGEIKKTTKLYALARFLALQIGQLVNVQELSLLTEISRASIYHYLDVLEQMSIIVKAYPLSTNERKAISTKFKVYFTDVGLRNALVENFSPWNMRLDRGQLLENAVFIGLKRQLDFAQEPYKIGFFRSVTGKEIDIVVQTKGHEVLYEVKSSKKYTKKQGAVKYITEENVVEFLD